MEKLKRSVIKEELVSLTGDFRKALILNQFIYWSERVKDAEYFIKEEKMRAKVGGIEIDIEDSNGWIYKTNEDLNDEIMINLSLPTLRKCIKELVEAGFINTRRNPKYKWDKTIQYRVDLVKVQTELHNLGYSLEGYPLVIEKANKKTPAPTEVINKEEALENTPTSNNIFSSNNNNTMNRKKNKEEIKNKGNDTEIIKLLKEHNFRGIDNKKANTLFKDENILIKAIDRCKNIKEFNYLVKVYDSCLYEETYNNNKSQSKGFNSWQGDYVNDDDLDSKIEKMQQNKFRNN